MLPLLILSFQLAVDLLQPKISSERRRHKLKRLVQHPNSFFMDVKAGVYYYNDHRHVICLPPVPRLLQDHHHLLSRAHCRGLLRLLLRAVSAHRGPDQALRRRVEELRANRVFPANTLYIRHNGIN